ncbi:YheC/YheD family protein [Paenibacillus doosanensis]|uniref:YheC/YheD family protein n=1 Tax=Paenibacillus doosanensis TaxID=1229154 RepID=UPI0021807287|nr:YheC/YheD family protein [Paenibacillus doosanensis]MCS7464345.1 YheC/YheD family protein [Paenibacillus doosanensis]
MAKWSSSKWSKYRVLKRSSEVKPHLPATYRMNTSALWRMLDRYGEAIVKPSGSYGGQGVLLISHAGDGRYVVHDGPSKKKVEGREKLESLVRRKASRGYIVQRRISLASIHGRPFDLRVMVQRRKGGSWNVTGKLAKVAGKGYIVTNVRRSRGKVVPVKTAIRQSDMKGSSAEESLRSIDKVSLATAHQMRKYYPGNRTLGIDMGLDKNGKVWIIEVNFMPMLGLFRMLKDKSMYRKITSYANPAAAAKRK